jgi:hypothetical protein
MGETRVRRRRAQRRGRVADSTSLWEGDDGGNGVRVKSGRGDGEVILSGNGMSTAAREGAVLYLCQLSFLMRCHYTHPIFVRMRKVLVCVLGRDMPSWISVGLRRLLCGGALHALATVCHMTFSRLYALSY